MPDLMRLAIVVSTIVSIQFAAPAFAEPAKQRLVKTLEEKLSQNTGTMQDVKQAYERAFINYRAKDFNSATLLFILAGKLEVAITGKQAGESELMVETSGKREGLTDEALQFISKMHYTKLVNETPDILEMLRKDMAKRIPVPPKFKSEPEFSLLISIDGFYRTLSDIKARGDTVSPFALTEARKTCELLVKSYLGLPDTERSLSQTDASLKSKLCYF